MKDCTLLAIAALAATAMTFVSASADDRSCSEGTTPFSFGAAGQHCVAGPVAGGASTYYVSVDDMYRILGADRLSIPAGYTIACGMVYSLDDVAVTIIAVCYERTI